MFDAFSQPMDATHTQRSGVTSLYSLLGYFLPRALKHRPLLHRLLALERESFFFRPAT
jgi:hypothetical protein